MIVLIDNRDSFTFNLVQALATLGAQVTVLPGARITLADVLALAPAGIVIGPGPGGPLAARVSIDIARDISADIPVLGICLGHQILAAAFGARTVPSPAPVHGHPAAIRHDGRGVFRGLPDPVTMGRYHSLSVVPASLPTCLEITAWAPDGTVQGLRHKERWLEGVQFHPESILSSHGALLLGNFPAR